MRYKTRYTGKICHVKKSEEKQGEIILTVGLRNRQQGEQMTRFMLVEEWLRENEWKIIRIRMPSFHLATSARISIPQWLRARGIPTAVESRGKDTILWREEHELIGNTEMDSGIAQQP